MSLSKKGSQTDTKLSSLNKATYLNPNAAEFVPFALRSSPSGSTSSVDAAARFTTAGSLGKAVLDRSESSISNNSDDEAHQYWRCQLPDDITPDFKVMGEDESQGNSLVNDTDLNPLEFLASLFPGFASESLAEVFFANACDLHLTIEMLTQLEIQVDGGFNQNPSPKTLSSPNLSAMDFPALTSSNGQNTSKYAADNVQQSGIPYISSDKDMLMFKSGSSIPSRGSVDFASAVRKLASQDSGIWKYDKNGSGDASTGSSRGLNALASAYNGGQGRVNIGDRLQSRGSARAAPVWLETGDAVANMYSELREEARDHARLRNAYFEQARQAYLIGNKALAKELSVKGQLHNMHMKAAHGKAQESIYRQRNPVAPENGRGHQRMIDLHGLHVSEAIHVLKHELSVLRSTARAAEQRLQVYICVGTGHHTRGSRTPARLPIAVQRYLLEEEGLDFTEPQPGLLRVVIY